MPFLNIKDFNQHYIDVKIVDISNTMILHAGWKMEDGSIPDKCKHFVFALSSVASYSFLRGLILTIEWYYKEVRSEGS